MSGRAHDREYFYKYASAETAMRIIAARSFRWSAPTNFNDPFDHQVGFFLDLDDHEFARHLTTSIERIVFTDAPVGTGASLEFTHLLLQLRAIRDRLRRADVLAELHASSLATAANLRSGIDNFNATIQSHLLHSRVFCVAERPDNIVMWSHYADEHRGVVFHLACSDALDNRLLAARRVTYADSFIAFPNAEEYAMHLTGERPLDFVALSWNMALTKHLDWSYEREWRVHIPLLQAPGGSGYSTYEEPAEVFASIYLGCRMASAQVEAILSAANQHLPHTKVYRAVRSTKSFSLVIELVYET